MIGCALALQILLGSMCSSYFGILADKRDASMKGCHGRLWIMFWGLCVSTFAMLLHMVASVAIHREDSKDIQPIPISTAMLTYHLIVRCIYSMGISATSPVLNGLTLARLERDTRHANEFGKERLYGAISWGIANSFFGITIDTFGFGVVYLTTTLSLIGCGVVFYLYARADDALLKREIIKHKSSDGNKIDDSCINIDAEFKTQLNMNDRDHLEEEKRFSEEDNAINIQKDRECNIVPEKELSLGQFSFSFVLETIYNQPALLFNICYMIALFTLYIGMSVVENLIFLYFEFLGGSNTLCGFTVAVTVFFELPIFHYAPDILAWMKSPVWMIQWGCLAYVVRVLGYSIIPESHAQWVLVLEPLHGLTIGFVLTGSVAFMDSLMPKGHESSGQGFLSSIMGLGQFFGLCIGGVLEGRVLYRVMAGIVSTGSLILALGCHLSVRPTTVGGGRLCGIKPSRINGNALKRKGSDSVYERVELDHKNQEFEMMTLN